jgi:methionine-rich copper-binding protein CopC
MILLLNRFKRMAWAIPLVALMGIVGAAGASAHAMLVKSEPANGMQVKQAPRRVTAWFSQELSTRFSTMQVVNAAGRQVDRGDGGVNLDDAAHATMTVTLPDSLPAGVYTVRWVAVSTEDGDPTQGEFNFGLAVVPTQRAATQPAAFPANRMTWLFTGLAFSVVLLVALVAFWWNGRQYPVKTH